MVTSLNPTIYKMYYPVFSSHHKERPKISSISMFRRPKQDLKNIDSMSCNFRRKRFNGSQRNSMMEDYTHYKSQFSGYGSVESVPERYTIPPKYGSPAQNDLAKKKRRKFMRTETFAI